MRRASSAAVIVVAMASILLAIPASNGASGSATGPGHHGRLLVTRLSGVHDARQVISVTTPHYRSVHATVRAFGKSGHGWHQVGGPWSAWIGRNGFAKPGQKREGDGMVPSGSFHFSYFFGVAPNPGVRFPWRHASRHDYWDDDSTSPRYNTWVDARHHSPGASPEPLHVQPSYDDVAVIAYNTSRVPYKGSAIFLHVTHHSPTSGCVALPRRHVLTLLRWLRPSKHPRIIMGRTATVTR
jgi:L,D-peptidoglycan transpeptidase YkuD (ErfK/YbiS/YcfS/YnhG family)